PRYDIRPVLGNDLLNDRLTELGDLLDRRRGTAGESLHLLFDFLALLFFALDVDLPAEKLRRQTHVLAIFADSQRELRGVDDDFELLFTEISDRNAADLGRLQRFFGEGGDLFAELDDVDLFAAQLADDRLHAHAFHADVGADRIDVLVAALHGDL